MRTRFCSVPLCFGESTNLRSDDQQKYDKAYEKWLRDRQKNDRDDIAKDEGKMQELMAKYNIPRDVPYNFLASSAKGYY